MTITEDLIAAGVKLRQRQEKAKAEMEAEREEQDWLREERAREFWKETEERETNEADILHWPRKEAKQ